MSKKKKGLEESIEDVAEKVGDVMFQPVDGKKIKRKIGEKLDQAVENAFGLEDDA